MCVCDCRGKEWDDVDKAEKERIELKKTEDGEFWYVTDTKTRQLTQLNNLSSVEEEVFRHFTKIRVYIYIYIYSSKVNLPLY